MTIKEKISEWVNERRIELAANYERIEPYGIFSKDENWGDLLESEAYEAGNGFKGVIKGPYYTYWLEHGRGPTKNRTPHNPTVREVVYRWITKYGIQSKNKKYSQATLAYFIAKNIHEKGIKVPGKYNPGGLVSDVITKDKVDELIKSVSYIFTTDLKSDVIKKLKNGNN